MPKRVDACQGSVVKLLRELGFTVQSLHMVGKGCPDIIAGIYGVNYLFELKSKGEKLDAWEQKWHSAWKGQVTTITELEGMKEWLRQQHLYPISPKL